MVTAGSRPHFEELFLLVIHRGVRLQKVTLPPGLAANNGVHEMFLRRVEPAGDPRSHFKKIIVQKQLGHERRLAGFWTACGWGLLTMGGSHPTAYHTSRSRDLDEIPAACLHWSPHYPGIQASLSEVI